MPQEITAKTGRTMNVNDQPPAGQLTTEDRVKHNAGMPQVGGQCGKGSPKNTLFVLLLILAKEKGRFFEAGEANLCKLWQPDL